MKDTLPSKHRGKAYAILVVAISFVVLLLLWRYRSETELYRSTIPIGDATIRVTAVRLEQLRFFDTPHVGSLISFGDAEIRTTLTFPDEHLVRVRGMALPRSLWTNGGQLYLICEGSGWEFYKILDRTAVSIKRSEMPEGQPPWNLLVGDDELTNLTVMYTSGESNRGRR